MAQMNAWLLDFGAGCRAAVGVRELLHLVDTPATFDIPCTPAYCHRTLLWQGHLLPIMDIAQRVGLTAPVTPFLAVVGYQARRGDYPQFGAFLLATAPRQLAVEATQACPLPATADWGKLAISCFAQQGQPIPILDLKRIFSTRPE